MSPAHPPPDPEKAALYSVSTSASPAPKTDESTRPRQEVTQCKPSMARQCPLFVLILFAFLAITFVSACYGRGMVRGFHCEEGQRRFQELLDSVDATALHNVLHEHARDKYQHGIYQDDKTTMEAMHRENAEVATSLVELARRQAGNTTAVTATETSTELVTSTSLRDTSTTPPGTSSQNQVADPSTSRIQAITPTTSAAPTTQAPDLTTSASPTTPSTEAPTSAPTAAASPPSISAGQSTNGVSLSSSTPGGTVSPASTVSLAGTVSPGGSVSPASTVSPAGTATPSSDSPVSSAASAIPSTSGPGIFTSSTTVVQQSISVTVQSSTRSQASSNGATVDSSPSSTPATQGSTSGASTSDNPTSNSSKSTHSITQQTIYTTTFAGGKVATVTQVTVVAADETGSSGGSKTTTAQGSLQTNGARSGKQVGLNGILGALGLVVAGVL